MCSPSFRDGVAKRELCISRSSCWKTVFGYFTLRGVSVMLFLVSNVVSIDKMAGYGPARPALVAVCCGEVLTKNLRLA